MGKFKKFLMNEQSEEDWPPKGFKLKAGSDWETEWTGDPEDFGKFADQDTWDEVVETGMGDPTKDQEKKIIDLGWYGKPVDKRSIDALNQGKSFDEATKGFTFQLHASDGTRLEEFDTLEELIAHAKDYPGMQRGKNHWVDDDGRQFEVTGATYEDIFGSKGSYRDQLGESREVECPECGNAVSELLPYKHDPSRKMCEECIEEKMAED